MADIKITTKPEEEDISAEEQERARRDILDKIAAIARKAHEREMDEQETKIMEFPGNKLELIIKENGSINKYIRCRGLVVAGIAETEDGESILISTYNIDPLTGLGLAAVIQKRIYQLMDR